MPARLWSIGSETNDRAIRNKTTSTRPDHFLVSAVFRSKFGILVISNPFVLCRVMTPVQEHASFVVEDYELTTDRQATGLRVGGAAMGARVAPAGTWVSVLLAA